MSENLNRQQFAKTLDEAWKAATAGRGMHDPDWGPLHRSDLPEQERGAGLYMGRSDTAGQIRHEYKHGISRTSMALDETGHPYRYRATSLHDPGTYTPQGPSAVGYLRERGHYADLEAFGETPTSPYDTEYMLKRNKALKDAGIDVLQVGE